MIKGSKKPKIVCGKDVDINSSIHSNPAGGDRCVFKIEKRAALSIGDRSGISNSVIVCQDKIAIGNNVMIGANCVIYDTDMHSVDYKDRVECPDTHIKTAPVTIKDGAWICGHCIILKGVTIGEKSVVAAGSVVSKDIPDGELWGGNPCRFIRKIYRDKTEEHR